MNQDLQGRIVRWFSMAVFAGLGLAWWGYPFFIEGAPGKWKLVTTATVEANLLVIASLLIGVAVVQGQNLNRMLDMRHAMKEKKAAPTETYKEIYDCLRIGFWLLAFDIPAVLGLLALTILLRGPASGNDGWELSNGAAFLLATVWWSVITLIVASWSALAIVAKRSYTDKP